MAKGKKVETETGSAILYPDGSMRLNNSGYIQLLTPEQVREAWKEDTISFSPKQQAEILTDFEDEDLTFEQLVEEGEMTPFLAEYDGEYWDFGEEMHVIPSYDEFHHPEKYED